MIEPEDKRKGEKKRVRVKIRSGRSGRVKKVTRLQVALVLLAAVIGGVVLGLLLGRLLVIARNNQRAADPYSSDREHQSGSGGPTSSPASSAGASGS